MHAWILGITLLAGSEDPPVVAPCEGGSPVAAAMLSSGFGSGSRGLLIAVWNDGRVLRARDKGDRESGYVETRIAPRDVAALLSKIEATGYWNWKQPLVGLDLANQQTVLCSGKRRLVLTHSVGGEGAEGATRVKNLLLAIESKFWIDAKEPWVGDYVKWFR
jgi:hypothetical protein